MRDSALASAMKQELRDFERNLPHTTQSNVGARCGIMALLGALSGVATMRVEIVAARASLCWRRIVPAD